MGEVFTPGGAYDLESMLKREFGDRLPTGDPRSSRDSLLGFMPSQGALVGPLTNLISITIDPDWWALHYLDSGATVQRISLTFLDLDSGISEQAAVQYADTQVVGRAEGYKSFVGVDNRQVTLRCMFRAQGISGVSGENTLENEVVRPARWLEGLKFPVVDSDGISHAPPPVILALGELLVMRAIATDVTVTWVGGWDPATLLPQGADVEVTFTGVHDNLGNYAYHGPTRFTGFQAPIG